MAGYGILLCITGSLLGILTNVTLCSCRIFFGFSNEGFIFAEVWVSNQESLLIELESVVQVE